MRKVLSKRLGNHLAHQEQSVSSVLQKPEFALALEFFFLVKS